MVTETKEVALNVRLTPELRDRLKAAYWISAPKHKQSYNAWLCDVLEAAVGKVEK